MPRIEVNDLRRRVQGLESVLAEAMQRVVRSGWFVLGSEVRAFEEEWAEYCQVAHAVGVANGTDALELSLRALGIGPGKSVATVANAGGYASAAICAVGARAVYVDVQSDTGLMDPLDLARVLNSNTVHAIVATHLYGQLADVQAIVPLADRHGIPVIEDCAQAHGARCQGRSAGSWGSLGTFSFYPTKNLGALGDGGAIVTNDAGLAGTLRELRQYGWRQKYHSGRTGGRNSRLDEMQAAILRCLLPRLDEWNQRRRDIAHVYRDTLADLDLGLPRVADERDVVHLFVLRHPNRDSLRQKLDTAGIGTDIHYPVPDYKQGAFAEPAIVSLSNTEELCDTILTVPCYPELADEEVRAVARAIEHAVQELSCVSCSS